MDPLERGRWLWEKQQKEKREEEIAAINRTNLIQNINGKFYYLAIAILIFNLALTLDYFAPKNITEDELLKFDNLFFREPMFGGSGRHPYTKLVFLNGELLMDRSVPFPVVFGTPAKISSTFIFSIDTAVEIHVNGQQYVFDELENFYSNARHLIWVIILVLILYRYVFVVPDHRLSFALLVFVLFCFEVVTFLRYA